MSKKKNNGWGREFASTFIRKGSHRIIKIVGDASLDSVFVGLSHDGILSVQTLSATGEGWKEVHHSETTIIRRGGAK